MARGRAARHPFRLAAVLGCLAVFVLAPPGASPAVATSDADNVTGTWECCGGGGAAAQVFVITSGTGALAGTARLPSGTVFATITGSAGGGKVTIVTTYNSFSAGYVATFVGTVSGGIMSGSWTSNAGQSGAWTATRSGVAPAPSHKPKPTPIPKKTTPTKKPGKPVCVPADCSGLKLTIDPDLVADLANATLGAGCGSSGGSGGGGGGSSACDIDAALELDLKGLQSSDPKEQLRAQKALEQDLAAFDAEVSRLEDAAQVAKREIERDAAATPPNLAELQKDMDKWGALMEEASGKSAALDAAQEQALKDLASSDPAVQRRGQQRLAHVQAEFQKEIDRIQAGGQAASSALGSDDPGAQQVPGGVGDELSDWQAEFQRVANEAAALDAAQEQAYADLASSDRATQLRGQQELQRVQERLEAQIDAIQRRGDDAQNAIRTESGVPGPVTQDVNSWDARFQQTADAAAALDAAEAQALRDLSSSNPQTQLRGQQALRDVQANFQDLSEQLRQQSASAAAEIYEDAALSPTSGWVDEISEGADNWYPSYDSSPVGGGPVEFDGALGPLYPADDFRSTAGMRARDTTAVGARPPSTRAVIHSIWSKHPTRGDMKAFDTAVRLATAKNYSPLRAKARLELTLAQHIGHAALVHELGYDLHTRRGGHGPVILSRSNAHIPQGATRKLTLRSTTLGGRILRLLALYDLSHPTSIRLHATSKHGGKTSTTSTQLAVG